MPNRPTHPNQMGILGGHAAAAANRARQPTGYRGPQVCAITGITYRQLDYWARTGLAVPSLNEAHGSGTARRYSHRDIVEIAVIKRLLDAGISLQNVRSALTYLRQHAGDDLAGTSLIFTGTAALLATTGEEISRLLAQGAGVLNILPLDRVLADVDTALGQLEPAAAGA